jgi:hypothetical protein
MIVIVVNGIIPGTMLLVDQPSLSPKGRQIRLPTRVLERYQLVVSYETVVE